ncbi:MAG: signal peptidase I [Bacilli bacterium]|nr:signal peptidase I [Bacilli bacterium]MBN2876227.1 signal peptidase I [Bacilli bacterium]
MKKTLKKVAGATPYLILLLAFILILSLTSALRKGDTPTIFGTAIFVITTPSMEDTLMVGDVIFVNTKDETYHTHDIITYHASFDANGDGEPENNVVTHRIVDIETINGVTYITTRGDNNDYSYDWETGFTTDQIIGKVTTRSEIITLIYGFLFSGGYNIIFLVIILVFITLGAMEASNIIKQLRMMKEKELEEEKEKLIQEELKRLRNEQEKKET